MRGRKPKPTAIKRRAGNPGKRQLKSEPQLSAADDLQCPRWLTGAAKREWRRVARDLQAAGVLMSTDMAALAGYCRMYERWIDAEQHVRKEGAVIAGERGKVRNPWVMVSKQAFDAMRAMMVELGLTPSSRSRIQAEPPSEDDDLVKFLYGEKATVGEEANR